MVCVMVMWIGRIFLDVTQFAEPSLDRLKEAGYIG